MAKLTFGNLDAFPVRMVGQGSQNALWAVGEVRFQGTTGLVATALGFPGFSAARLGTGSYELSFPAAVAMDLVAVQVHNPSGYFVGAYPERLQTFPGSGTARVQVGADGVTAGTGQFFPMNPATGTTIKVLFLAHPTRSF